MKKMFSTYTDLLMESFPKLDEVKTFNLIIKIFHLFILSRLNDSNDRLRKTLLFLQLLVCQIVSRCGSTDQYYFRLEISHRYTWSNQATCRTNYIFLLCKYLLRYLIYVVIDFTSSVFYSRQTF